MAELKATIAELTRKVERLNDAHEIRLVLNRYGRGLDRHDVDLLKSAFWQDAQVNYGNYVGLRDNFVHWGNELHATSTSRHEHHITNQNIDIDGDTAHVESYLIYLLRGKDEQSTVVGGARYIDMLERRNGEWRIALREFLPDILFRANSTFKGEFSENWCPPEGEGTWDRSDLSYRRPLPRRAVGETENPSFEIRMDEA